MAKIKWSTEPTGRRVVIDGMITAAEDLTELASGSQVATPLTLDVGGIRAFTSSGIQAWLETLRRLRGAGCGLVFERLSPAVVRQTMSIYDFLAGGAIRSVLAPYLCPACDAEGEEEIAVVDPPPAVAPTRRCTCGTDMDFDDLPGPYACLLREATGRPS